MWGGEQVVLEYIFVSEFSWKKELLRFGDVSYENIVTR